MPQDRPKIGLALGSGGSRGLAHIGVIKVFERENIPIDIIAGSSIGAFVGALYAKTRDIKWVEEISLSGSWLQIADFLFDPSMEGGLVSGGKVETYVRSLLGDLRPEELSLPFIPVATDFTTGAATELMDCPVFQAVRASMSVPFVFAPCKIGERLYLDGGLSEPLPIQPLLRRSVDTIIAINLDGPDIIKFRGSEKNPLHLLKHSFNIFRHNLSRRDIPLADVCIEPETGLGDIISWQGFAHAREVIKAGEKAALQVVNHIHELIGV